MFYLTSSHLLGFFSWILDTSIITAIVFASVIWLLEGTKNCQMSTLEVLHSPQKP